MKRIIRNVFQKLEGKDFLEKLCNEEGLEYPFLKNNFSYENHKFLDNQSFILKVRKKQKLYSINIHEYDGDYKIPEITVEACNKKIILTMQETIQDVPFILKLEKDKRLILTCRMYTTSCQYMLFNNLILNNLDKIVDYILDIPEDIETLENVFDVIKDIAAIKEEMVEGVKITTSDLVYYKIGESIREKREKVFIKDKYEIICCFGKNDKIEKLEVKLYPQCEKISEFRAIMKVYFNKQLTGKYLASYIIDIYGDEEVRRLNNQQMKYTLSFDNNKLRFNPCGNYDAKYNITEVRDFTKTLSKWISQS